MIAQIILIIVSVLLIATSAVALECYTKNESFWRGDKTKEGSRIFIIFMIVLGSLSILGSFGSFFIGKS